MSFAVKLALCYQSLTIAATAASSRSPAPIRASLPAPEGTDRNHGPHARPQDEDEPWYVVHGTRFTTRGRLADNWMFLAFSGASSLVGTTVSCARRQLMSTAGTLDLFAIPRDIQNYLQELDKFIGGIGLETGFKRN